MTFQYGILMAETQAEVYNEVFSQNQSILLKEGTLCKFQYLNTSFHEICLPAIVHVISTSGNNLLLSKEKYKCSSMNLRALEERMFNILLAIKTEFHRVRLLEKPNFIKFVLSLKVGEKVNIPGNKFGKQEKHFQCIIKYIGPCPEISHGTFYGFQIMVCSIKF